MKTVYRNQQHDDDPFNGSTIDSEKELVTLLKARSGKPLFIRLSFDDGCELLLGIAQGVGCVQHSASSGRSPNLLAVSALPPLQRGYIEFLTADTPTPVAARYIISFDDLLQIAVKYFRTGERSDKVVGEKFNPRALREDAERAAS